MTYIDFLLSRVFILLALGENFVIFSFSLLGDFTGVDEVTIFFGLLFVWEIELFDLFIIYY